MTEAALTPIEIGLTAAIVTVEGEEPAHPGRGRRRQGRDPRRAAVRSVRSARASHLRDRPARLGQRADRRSPSAMSSSSTPSATAAATRAPTTPARTWSRSAISRSPACRRMSPRCAPPAPASSRGTASSRGRTGATGGRTSSTRSSCRCSNEWAAGAGKPKPARALGRRERVRLCFGGGGSPWDEEKVLDRYELLYEAGLVEEARRDGREAALARRAVPHAGRADAASTTAASSRPRSPGCAPS